MGLPELLFDVTALIVTSTALGHAAEASSVPVTVSISAPLHPSDSAPPVTVNTASSIVDPGSTSHGIPITTLEIPLTTVSKVRALSGVAFVEGLSTLSPAQIDKIISGDPQQIEKILNSPPSAKDVTAAWAGMSTKTQAKLLKSAPQLVGNLEGVPVSIRNVANRTWVTQSIDSLKSKMASVAGRAVAQSDQQELQMLTRVDAALKRTKNGPERSLLSINPSGQGKAVIVIGNIQTANYVTYMVPGLFNTVDGQLGAWTGAAANLYSQQVAWLNRLKSVDPSDAHKSVAVVAWMGYQTPDLTNVASLQLANQAKDAMTRDVEAMQELRTGNEPFTTIIAHSYGSTAALMALSDGNFSVNALVVVGSPGSAAQSAKDLDVKHTNVWVGSAAWDPVPTSAFFGSDPSSPSYGAHTMGVNGGTDIITGKTLTQSLGHNGYFDPDSESVRNMALIGIDQAQLVMQGDAADSSRTLAGAK